LTAVFDPATRAIDNQRRFTRIVGIMDSIRRFFGSNLLFFLTLAGSLVGHASLGWYGRSTTEGPRLDREESGHTSVAVQWVAQPPPISLAPLESTEPLLWDRYVAADTPNANPAEIQLARNPHRDWLPWEPSIEGMEPLLSARPPEPQRRSHEPPELSIPRRTESRPDDRAIARHQQPRPLPLEPSLVDVPETLVSLDSSGADVPPSFVTRPLPVYPEELLLRRIEGVVRLVVTVQRDGRVASAKIHATSGYAEMDESALRTVRQWVFSPARRAGVPVQDIVIVPVRFKIRSRD
jgi:TonB family protein